MKPEAHLIRRIRKRTANLTVLGLGHVGLPTALVFARARFNVTGVDIDSERVNALNRGQCEFKETGLRRLLNKCVQNGTFEATIDSLSSIKKSDFVSICVPTPVRNMTPALSDFGAALRAVKAAAHQKMMVLLESTLPVSTTSKRAATELATKELRLDQDIFLAYCPERLAPGRALKEFAQNTRIVGAVGPRSGQIAAELYKTVCRKVIITDSLTAELVKLSENTFRDVNIAYANLVALIAEQNGVDANQVISLANTHPRVAIHRPGLGVGGPCLPKDPLLLIQNAPADVSQLVRSSRKLNDHIIGHAIDRVSRTLSEIGRDIKLARVTILGVAYKPGTDDVTNSPAKFLIEELLKKGSSVIAFDPCTIETFGAARAPTLSEAIRNSDSIFIVTAHAVFKKLDLNKLRQLVKKQCVIFDGPRVLDPTRARMQGLIYLGSGYGVAS
jgi:UDP-N-acetyl-D-mannosaminuronic acid dehydrogenase